MPSLGDRLSFLIVAVALVFTFFFPREMRVIAVAWPTFVTYGILRTAWLRRKSEHLGDRITVVQFAILWSIFNIPTALMAAIVWWRWSG